MDPHIFQPAEMIEINRIGQVVRDQADSGYPPALTYYLSGSGQSNQGHGISGSFSPNKEMTLSETPVQTQRYIIIIQHLPIMSYFPFDFRGKFWSRDQRQVTLNCRMMVMERRQQDRRQDNRQHNYPVYLPLKH